MEAEIRRRARNKIRRYYPDSGPLRRELYPKHLEVFRAGREHSERLLIAANRIGKSEGVGAYETTLHLTGQYPDWWEGKRFTGAITAWVAGDTSKTVRDIVQVKILGQHGEWGMGMIPGDLIVGRPTAKPGIPDAVETVYVRHTSGRNSTLVFKSYEQGREAFQGTEIEMIWLDEEPPLNIYTECLMRTMATGSFPGGCVLLTFTPLLGWTEVVELFLNEDERKKANRHYVQAGWDDAPHLSQEEKEKYLAKVPAYQRDARSKGIPQLGSGAIYPVGELEIVVDDFSLPAHFARAFGMDVGWNKTAAIWGAKDRESGVIYLYSEHYQGEAQPPVHAEAIKARGDWIPGVIDPASRGRSQHDGQQLIAQYRALGLSLQNADNSVEAGIYQVWTLLTAGQIKVFQSCRNWFDEYRLYRRDEKGKIVKSRDHLMDATRYLIMSGRSCMRTKPIPPKPSPNIYTSAWS
jgi:phage terminase large subunit-like protein